MSHSEIPESARRYQQIWGELPPEYRDPATAEYKFDVVAVVTFTVRTAHGEDAARQVAASVETAEGLSWDADTSPAPDATFQITCTAPRGKPYLVSAEDADGNEIPHPDAADEAAIELIPQPLLDARDSLREALDEADEALGGDSNDAEHDALYSVRETIAGLLGVTTDPPSPYDDDNDEEDSEPAPYDVLARRVELAGLTQDKLRMILVNSGHPAHAADANVLDSRTDLINAIIRAGL